MDLVTEFKIWWYLSLCDDKFDLIYCQWITFSNVCIIMIILFSTIMHTFRSAAVTAVSKSKQNHFAATLILHLPAKSVNNFCYFGANIAAQVCDHYKK